MPAIDPDLAAMLNDIKARLHTLASTGHTTTSAGADVFEAFCWAIVADVALGMGATVTFADPGGTPVTALKLPTSPRQIFNGGYSHAGIALHGRRMEAHIGIYAKGSSTVQHECDVAVLNEAEAKRCRTGSRPPVSAHLRLVLECKYYKATALSLGLGRGFLGLGTDLATPACALVTSFRGRSWAIETLVEHGPRSATDDYLDHVLPGHGVAPLEGFVRTHL